MGADFENLDDNAPMASINVTPFVDVALVLLVIFMVTAPVLLKDVLGLQLPKAKTSDGQSPESLGIAITRQGQILLAGKPVGDEELKTEVAARLKATSQLQAILAADADARHGDVVRAIDLIKAAGLNRFALQIEREN